MEIGILKTIFGGINTDNLIDSTCFYLKISQSYVFIQILVESACFAMIIV